MTPCSAVGHLADALFLSGDQSQRYFCIMTGSTAYFDASGTRDTVMMSVGGYVSNVNDWKQFEIKWKETLAWAKVPYCHMKKFTAHRYPFDNKKWEREELRKEFLGRLIDAIARNVDFFILNLLPINDWNTVNAEYCMEEAQLTPFAVVSCGAMLGLEEWCRMKGIPWDQAEVISEDGDTDKGDFLFWSKKSFHKTPILKPGIPDDDEPDEYPLSPLQACDFGAWESRRAETDVEAHPDTY